MGAPSVSLLNFFVALQFLLHLHSQNEASQEAAKYLSEAIKLADNYREDIQTDPTLSRLMALSTLNDFLTNAQATNS